MDSRERKTEIEREKENGPEGGCSCGDSCTMAKREGAANLM